jgi:predicted DNA-binding transcriptional regulator YafY
LIKKAIADENILEIVYLKANDIKSKRTIIPYKVGKSQYRGKDFIGLKGYCQTRKEDRIFRVDRILKIIDVKA